MRLPCAPHQPMKFQHVSPQLPRTRSDHAGPFNCSIFILQPQGRQSGGRASTPAREARAVAPSHRRRWIAPTQSQQSAAPTFGVDLRGGLIPSHGANAQRSLVRIAGGCRSRPSCPLRADQPLTRWIIIRLYLNAILCNNPAVAKPALFRAWHVEGSLESAAAPLLSSAPERS